MTATVLGLFVLCVLGTSLVMSLSSSRSGTRALQFMTRPFGRNPSRDVKTRGLSSSMTANNLNEKSDYKNGSSLLQPLVVCGPSGAGKGTIIEKYMSDFGGKGRFGFTVSHTTRAPREGEVDGVHYHFSNLAEMKQQIEEGNYFLEHAEVHGNYYGTSWSSMWDVQNSGKHCLLDIDVQGVKNLKSLQNEKDFSNTFQPKYLFIAPPSLAILQERLSLRGTESASSLQRRTENAKAEVEYGMEKGNFDVIVINDDLSQACRDFDAAVKTLYGDFR